MNSENVDSWEPREKKKNGKSDTQRPVSKKENGDFEMQITCKNETLRPIKNASKISRSDEDLPRPMFLADHSPPFVQLIMQTKTGDSLPYSIGPACWDMAGPWP